VLQTNGRLQFVGEIGVWLEEEIILVLSHIKRSI